MVAAISDFSEDVAEAKRFLGNRGGEAFHQRRHAALQPLGARVEAGRRPGRRRLLGIGQQQRRTRIILVEAFKPKLLQ